MKTTCTKNSIKENPTSIYELRCYNAMDCRLAKMESAIIIIMAMKSNNIKSNSQN